VASINILCTNDKMDEKSDALEIASTSVSLENKKAIKDMENTNNASVVPGLGRKS